MNLLKTLNLYNSISSCLRAALYFSNSLRQLIFKFLSSRLNIRPYNRLDKEVVDFKECKEGLVMPHNIKYFYLEAGTLQG